MNDVIKRNKHSSKWLKQIRKLYVIVFVFKEKEKSLSNRWKWWRLMIMIMMTAMMIVVCAQSSENAIQKELLQLSSETWKYFFFFVEFAANFFFSNTNINDKHYWCVCVCVCCAKANSKSFRKLCWLIQNKNAFESFFSGLDWNVNVNNINKTWFCLSFFFENKYRIYLVHCIDDDK